jgi:Domain of unknown function (DUF4082)/Bacterial Ig-like domain/Bacterial Ig domain
LTQKPDWGRTALIGDLRGLLHGPDGNDRALSAGRARRGRRAGALIGAPLLVLGLLVAMPASAMGAGSSCGANINPIVCENEQPGTPESVWDNMDGAGDPAIQGFATDISVNRGSTISFKIDTDATRYTVDIYRLGYYGGDGARLMTPAATIIRPGNQHQPACVTDPTTEIFDCGTWAVSASWSVPATAVSGVYIAEFTRTDTGGASMTPFVVRDDSSQSDIYFKTSDSTWQAYNTYGGSDFYQGVVHDRAYKVSYNRPYATRDNNHGRDFLFSNEYPMIRFMEQNGYDVSYTTDVDMARNGALAKNHKVLTSTGHDEYWSAPERDAAMAARDAGVNLAFFSGNEVYWHTRWEASEDGSNSSYRTLVCYKETWANAKIDPSTEWTGTWRDPRFTPPATGGGIPENNLTGAQYQANDDDFAIQVPSAEGKLRFWRNTSVASLAAGSTATLAQHTGGYESDEDVDNGFRPAGLMDLSTTVASTTSYLTDFGNVVVAGTTKHQMTLYRAPSGALVFDAGTIQWAWGLDSDHDGLDVQAPDSRMQQATVNLLADMGVQPATRMSGLAAATRSTDVTAPTVTITSPANGASYANGSSITVSGTAADTGGGVVAAVEVSTNGGATWHPATGTTSWSYTFVSSGLNTLQLQVRATDDSGNLQATPASATYTLTGQHSIFGQATPKTAATNDTSAVTLGVKWKASTDGYVTGIRFYKGSGNTGTHTGALYTASGTRLATGTFSGESASGWQTLTFTSPVAVTGNTVYVATYYAPSGHYSADPWVFSYRDYVAAPLSATRSLGTNANGLYIYGNAFPTQSTSDTNYYVDVTFIANADSTPSVVLVSPTDGDGTVALNVHPSAVFNKSIDPSTLSFTLADSGGHAVAGSAAYDDTAKAATFTPSAALVSGTVYTATVSAKDTSGHSMAAPKTWSFTGDPDANAARLFALDATPTVASANDGDAVELGTKFIPTVNGTVTGLRFYKGSGNTGPHTGSLWSSGGTLLATASFGTETDTGWQTVHFATPVTIAAGSTYIVSYYAPHGHYAADGQYFASTLISGVLTAPAGSNGVYRYGSDAFPNSTYNSTNYWVDPLFVPGEGSTGTSTSFSLFPATLLPDNTTWDDSSSLEVGVQFSSDLAGKITGIRFYKGSGNTGTHTGTLWNASGNVLATGTFTGETDSGWQTLTFSTPVSVTPGTIYTASYFAPAGHYAVNLNQFASGYAAGPLHVAATGGRYQYGSGGYPTGTTNHNFLVDIMFQTGP